MCINANKIRRVFGSGTHGGEQTEFSELSRAAELVRKGGAEAVLMRGGVPDSAANALIAAGRALNGLEIICEDGSRLLLSHKNYEKLVRAGARFTVMNKTRLLAVTVNPFSAKGSHYNKRSFTMPCAAVSADACRCLML